MNEQERAELARLKEQQARLQEQLSLLSGQLSRLEQRLSQPAAEAVRVPPQPAAITARPIETAQPLAAPKAQPPMSEPIPVKPPPIPPVISKIPEVAQSTSPSATATIKAAPVLEPGASGQTPAPSGKTRADVAPASLGSLARAPKEPAEARSLEMRVGTYWLVRIGIVMVLTGLVFFGNLAYQNYIRQLGPAGKVTLLYLASAILLGAGAWWQRKVVKESLKNYAQVLFAGGLAAVYFTTYAAHYNEHLRVIQNPLVDGVLLLAWAGFMVWVADRRKSEVLALFAVGLAYYSSIITRVGSFTLYSNLVLTAAAVFFLVRNRWATLSFGSLVATYAAYAFWRFFDGSAWHWASPEEGLWTGVYFLASYWLLFTAAVFLSRDEKFAGQPRAGFLTLNNGAFFSMFLLTMLQVRHGGFWKFSLCYGSVLLVLAELARRVLATEPLAKNFYLTQGLLLVTLGLISHPKLAGLQLALVLAAESVVLLMLGQARKDLLLQAGAYIVAALAVGWGMDGLRQFEPNGLWLGMALGALMLANTLLAHRDTVPIGPAPLRPQVGYFTALALAIWLVATWDNTTREHFPVVLAAEGLLLTFSIYLLRVREITLLAQGYLLLAQLAWFAGEAGAMRSPPWWNPVLLIAITLGLSHWWQRQKTLELGPPVGLLLQGVYALAIVGVLYFWLGAKVEAPAWLVLTSLLGVGLTAYGVLTRAWFLAACGQIFVLVSGAQFARQLWEAKPAWPLPLAPIAALGLLSFGTVNWFARKPGAEPRVREPLLQIALLYRWAALGMSIGWVYEYIPARERIWALMLLGLLAFLWAGWRRNREALLFSAAFTLTGLVSFWLPRQESLTLYWPNPVAILALLAQQRIAKRAPDRYGLDARAHAGIIILGGFSLWLYVWRWVVENAGGFYLTASWSILALALFTAGIVLRERMYRWLGLGVLACALGRVVIFDVWKLETPYRILSFMALGVVLLVLGFIYSKYQEKIREWL
jgi:uncharacterized membrane protein